MHTITGELSIFCRDIKRKDVPMPGKPALWENAGYWKSPKVKRIVPEG